MNKYDILVIGGGPAGITISKMLGKKMRVGIIRPEDHSMIYCAMPYAIEKVIPIEKTLKKDSLVTDAGADLIRDRVSAIDYDAKIVFTERNDSYGYEKLVLATGAVPVVPNIPGKDLDGVMTFKMENDLRRIMDLAHSNSISKAVVVGAGAIGVELSQSFNSAGIETHLVDMADSILSTMVDREMIEEAEEELIKLGILLHLNTRVVELRGGGNVDEVVLDNGNVISFKNADTCSTGGNSDNMKALVVFAVGMQVDKSIYSDPRLETGRDGIIVNDKMETSIKDVYAVGDCAQFTSGITGDVLPGKLATNAVPMAKIFAYNQLGNEKKYPGFYNGAATKIGPYFAGGTGYTEKSAIDKFNIVVGSSEMTTIFPNMPGAKKIKMKMIVEQETLKIVGAQFISGEPVTDKIDIITLAIQNDLTAKDCAQLSYSSQPYQSFFPANNLIVAAAEDVLRKV